MCAVVALDRETEHGVAALAPAHDDVTPTATKLLGYIGGCSLVVIIMTAGGRSGLGLYAFAVGTISLAVVLVVFLHRALRPEEASEVAQELIVQKSFFGAIKCQSLVSLFLTLWWACGAAIATFLGPFTATSNPYICCWVALVCSSYLFVETVFGADPLQRARQAAARATGIEDGHGSKRAYSGLLFSSAVLMGACAAPGVWSSEIVYSVVAASVTVLLVFLLLLDQCQLGKPLFAIHLRALFVWIALLLWLFVVWFTTFAGPFVTTGNGYFAAWLGLLSACLLLDGEDGAKALLRCHGRRSHGGQGGDGSQGSRNTGDSDHGSKRGEEPSNRGQTARKRGKHHTEKRAKQPVRAEADQLSVSAVPADIVVETPKDQPAERPPPPVDTESWEESGTVDGEASSARAVV